MTDLDLAYTSATEFANLYRQRELSPVEIVENCLARVGQVNSELNAFCAVHSDEAIDAAKSAEAIFMGDREAGPLCGIPLALKDFAPLRGKVTTRGSSAFKNWIPDDNPIIVERLVQAGAIVLGKTTTPEFAFSSFTESPLWGITRNPWDRDRTPGGSAAVVASGCVPLAEGSDMGGSVRIPAALCGVVGLKPSLDRIPMDILPSVFDSISHFGPLTRTVEDAALFLSVAQGADDVDIQSLPDRLAIPRPLTGDVQRHRLALSLDLGFFAVDDDIRSNTEAAALMLEKRGARIESIDLKWTREIVDAWFAY